MGAAFIRLTKLGIPVFGLIAMGCASSQLAFSDHGVLFFCDGAGGGGITNWGPGVQKGLADGGFTGTFDEFKWETGLGVVVDETEGVKAKRAQAAKLAKAIASYQSRFPDSPVHLIGSSAGTCIAIFALEALPASNQVDTVVMLSSAVSSAYDLTQALRHVRGDLYVTTSPNDLILSEAVALLGTADRKFVGQEVAGLHGFALPSGADAATRRLYSHIVLLAWDPAWESYGDAGGHTDTAKPAFVQHVVAPLLIRDSPRLVRVHAQGTGGTYRTVSE